MAYKVKRLAYLTPSSLLRREGTIDCAAAPAITTYFGDAVFLPAKLPRARCRPPMVARSDYLLGNPSLFTLWANAKYGGE